MRTALFFTAAAMLMAGTIGSANAAGDLTVRATELEELVFGTDENTGFGMSETEYDVETGKPYRLEIAAGGFHEFAIMMPELMNASYVVGLEVDEIELKVGNLYEIGLEEGGEIELTFVPIRPGSYKIYARDMENRGMVATVNVK
ncbi:copper-binding protein [Marinivivus vitaminiproducens]|uniref:copper-binding protein n=1 Tax=Marinivivus vitaminiproducens TaxID=3035935 RepID=UPI0027AAEA0E|nr:hypothetical protein P4R82_06100 [Geminicoccaceae bacterium SCSIO 64248]